MANFFSWQDVFLVVPADGRDGADITFRGSRHANISSVQNEPVVGNMDILLR